jgi:hypothetical protein
MNNGRIRIQYLRPPQRFRNSHFLEPALLWFLPALVGAVITVASPDGRLIGLLLFLVSAALTAYFVLSWRRVDLRVASDHIEIGGLLQSHSLSWNDIRRFEILPPPRRRPFLVMFRPWTLQAHVTLRDGSTRRVRAIDPRGVFTPLTWFGMIAPGQADAVVEWLNQLVEAHSAQPGDR